ncbi:MULTISPECIES: hypothetical protein [unclassified Paenibacillus]|uniref:hypothetical protein n=1 Tax=unclassified Paenibacillus TaxID=185978 RepID=UPI00070B4F9C|nr:MULTISPECIES: hypothetical protein [unclassified Paenibacillus]KQX44696.1 hypothetical protein ASD40_22130 [Paenibacillus sp. Root444D2]KRE33001.1 hypothetical protein ASG85_15985 [Paenibacillus sp. Soil724D2]
MALITHVNVCNTENEIYCCLRNKIVKLDDQQKEQFCTGCKMFAGDADEHGTGVSCVWEDVRVVSNPHIALDPLEEFIHNQIRQVPPEGPALFLYTTEW